MNYPQAFLLSTEEIYAIHFLHDFNSRIEPKHRNKDEYKSSLYAHTSPFVSVSLLNLLPPPQSLFLRVYARLLPLILSPLSQGIPYEDDFG